MKFNKFLFASLLSFLPFQQISIFASELEEIKVKKSVNSKGNLVVKFCSNLDDYSGFVEVENKKFMVSSADVANDKKIVWKDTNLTKTKGDNINTNNLLSEGKVIVDGNCNIGILPIVILTGIAIGAASGGGSGSSSSN
tara:strand:- start:173 stop:589 length:417 start_codon:yes stop_codon:yes gene_type:complete